MLPKTVIALLAGSCLVLPVAGLAASAGAAYPQPDPPSEARAGGQPETAALTRFTPAPARNDHRLDWAHWDDALTWMVIPMGPSLRQGASRVDPRTGTRRIYGHESRLRLEGNRVAFSFLTPEIVTALGEYRADLERIGSELNVARLPRNEQLAYWFNLHNVAMIEALAQAYPLRSPYARTFGPNEAAIDDAKLVTVAGVALSPRDIRERIVYPGWQDPKVIYGFWRGDIGSPSIQRLAFTGANVDLLLSLSAEEFVNSLRGVEAWGGALRVSRIYAEAAPFYFSGDTALRAHLGKYATEDVKRLLQRHDQIRYSAYGTDIADLSRGERDASTSFLCIRNSTAVGVPGGVGGPGDCATPETVIDPSAARLMEERGVKLERAWRKGIRLGTVIVAEGEAGEEREVR